MAGTEGLKRGFVLHAELGAAASGIFEGITGELGNSGGDARLVLAIETQEFGEVAGSLADDDDVGLALQCY